MKKIILLMLCVSILSFNASAIGIEISIKKGIREWNQGGTAAECIGAKKVCEFKFKVDFPLSLGSVASMEPGTGGVFNNNGQITICLPEATLSDEYWTDIFEDSYLNISDDHVFTTEEKNALGSGCPDVIPAGDYPITIENGVIIVDI